MRSLSAIGRVAAVGALIAALVLVSLVLFGGGGAGGYKVKARFLNAGQLVKGNPVQVGGVPVGSVKGIKITSDGHAEIEMSIDGDHSPLRRGTRAEIRQFSQSGLANRYIDLKLPPDTDDTIADGGVIDTDNTVTQVDLDELYNTLDPETRRSLQGFFQHSADQWRGREREANVGFQYLNPALSTSSRLFNELTKDTPVLERFLVDSSRMVTALAERRDDLAGLIGNLNETTRALGSQKEALAESIGRLPPFMRRANTTFVDLRSTLDEVDPLVEASKPVAKRLQPFLSQARAFAADAEPTVRDLSITIRRKGGSNDLIDLLHSFPPLAEIATATKQRSYAPGGRSVRTSARRAAPSRRPSTRSRAAPARSASPARTPPTSSAGSTTSRPPAAASTRSARRARGMVSFAPVLHPDSLATKQYRRCPGSAEAPAKDGSNVLSEAEREALGCEESHRAVPK